jgi:hypothetical protein
MDENGKVALLRSRFFIFAPQKAFAYRRSPKSAYFTRALQYCSSNISKNCT